MYFFPSKYKDIDIDQYSQATYGTNSSGSYGGSNYTAGLQTPTVRGVMDSTSILPSNLFLKENMKQLQYILVFISAALLAISCNKQIEEKQTDPNNPTTVPSSLILGTILTDISGTGSAGRLSGTGSSEGVNSWDAPTAGISITAVIMTIMTIISIAGQTGHSIHTWS